MNLQLSSKDDLCLNLGFCCFLPIIEGLTISKVLIIDKKLNFGYWSKRLLIALNTGLINQSIYDTIKANENNTKQYYVLDQSFPLDKNILINLIEKLGLLNIETSGDAFSILVQLNELNYQLISKI